MNVLILRNAVIAVLCLTAPALNAAEEPASSTSPVFSLRGGVDWGQAEGFLQTPRGGQPGTSSIGRPTLDELGIDDTVFYDVLARADWRQFVFFAGYQAITLDGQAQLSETLVTWDTIFPAGTDVNSETDLDWLRVAAGWKFELADRRLELVPKAEFALLDFSYHLSGGGQAVERSYAKGAVRFGLEGRYRFSRVFSVSLDGGASLPISNMPQIATLTGLLEFNVLPRSQRVSPTLFLGGGAQRIEYEDNQELSNHFRVDFKPVLTAGLAIRF